MDSRLFTTGIPADNSDAAGHGKLFQPGLAAAGSYRNGLHLRRRSCDTCRSKTEPPLPNRRTGES